MKDAWTAHFPYRGNIPLFPQNPQSSKTKKQKQRENAENERGGTYCWNKSFYWIVVCMTVKHGEEKGLCISPLYRWAILATEVNLSKHVAKLHALVGANPLYLCTGWICEPTLIHRKKRGGGEQMGRRGKTGEGCKAKDPRLETRLTRAWDGR